MKNLLAAFAATLTMSTAVTAAEFNPLKGFPTTVTMVGEINLGDDAKFYRVLQHRHDRGIAAEYLMLHSPGGLLYPASKMAWMVRNLGIKTVVGGYSVCASACMLTFAGGVERHAWVGAQLGVHNTNTGRDGNGDGFGDPDGDGTVHLAQEMTDLGTPASVIAKLVITPPDSMAWLDDNDVAGWVQIHNPATAYVQPERPQPQPRGTGPVQTMTCQSQKGNTYTVNWDQNNPGNIQVNDNWYMVVKSRYHPGTSIPAWVIGGKTKYGHYTAVLGGTNPRMEFSNGKEKVTDRCW